MTAPEERISQNHGDRESALDSGADQNPNTVLTDGVRSGLMPDLGDVAVSQEWLRQRLDAYERTQRVVVDEVAQALRAAVEARADVERAADAELRRLRTERSRLEQEVSSLQRERDQLPQQRERQRAQLEAELTAELNAVEDELRQAREDTERELRAYQAASQEEADRIREETRARIDEVLGDVLSRREEMAAQLRLLEGQVVDIQGRIDTFLSSQLQSLRGRVGTAPGVGAGKNDPGGD